MRPYTDAIIGRKFIHNRKTLAKSTYNHGGAGYVLSRGSLYKIAMNPSLLSGVDVTTEKFADVEMGKSMKRYGIDAEGEG